MKKSQRTNLAKLTLSILKEGGYTNKKNDWIDLSEIQQNAVKNSRLYTPALNAENTAAMRNALPQKHDTVFELYNETTLQACRRLTVEEGKTVAAQNFASAKNPGGGFLGGSQAQEESLARSSGLYPTLLAHRTYYNANRKFPSNLYTDHIIWSPLVPIFLTDEGVLLDAPYLVSFITAPAPNAGAVRRNTPGQANEIPIVMERRIEQILAIAAAQGEKTLVLGAFGCGVFRNDALMVAKKFGKLLLEGGFYEGAFEKVVFAVLDKTKDQAVFKAFAKVF